MSTATAATDGEDDVLDPGALIGHLVKHLNLKNDASLSRVLEVAPPVISKIRRGRMPVGPTMLIRMHEVSDISIKDLRALMGDRRAKVRPSAYESM
jgi:plasmid maintenance system antidote protein VapI